MRCKSRMHLYTPSYDFDMKPACPWEAENGKELCYKCAKYAEGLMEPSAVVMRIVHDETGGVIWEP